MPRPTEQGLIGTHDTTGFSPSATPTTQLNVVAPLDVDAAPTQAMALAKALGHGNDIAQQALGKMAREQGSADEAQGEAAASMGLNNPSDSDSVSAATHGFAIGFTKVQTQQKAFQAADAAKQFAAANPTMPLNDYTNDDGSPAQGLLHHIDAIYKQAFPGGEEKDPEAARAMSPILSHTINEIAGQRNLDVIKNTQQNAEDVETAKLSHDLQNGTQFFNKDDALTTLKNVYGNDDRAALSALVHVVGEGGVTGANPSVIRQLLPKDADFGGGVRLTPADQMYLDNAVARATEAQNRNNRETVKQSADNITLLTLNGKDPLPAIKEYLKLPGADAGEARAMFDWAYKKGKETESDNAENNQSGWEMSASINRGELTNGGQIMAFLDSNNLAGTKVGNLLLQKGMSELRNVQNINQDDPDYRASRDFVFNTYRPAVGPLGKLMNPTAQSQQTGALSDYNTEYTAQVRQGKSSTEAARAARASVVDKWGAPVEDPKGMANPNATMPTADVDRAAVIHSISTGSQGVRAFHAAGITATDVVNLTRNNLISVDEGELAMRLIIAKHQR